jgi:hypothetical protein
MPSELAVDRGQLVPEAGASTLVHRHLPFVETDEILTEVFFSALDSEAVLLLDLDVLLDLLLL